MISSVIVNVSKKISSLIPHTLFMPILTGPMKGMKWLPKSGNLVCALGKYENQKVQQFLAEIHDRMVVYDIGANNGYYTLIASKKNPNGCVVAFEPFPENVFTLQRHIELNKLDNVHIINAAVTEFTGLARFEGNIEKKYMNKLNEQGTITVKTVKLDDLVESEIIKKNNLLKIDAEGAEATILSGGKTIISESHPTIFLATHGKLVHQKCCKFLKDLGYAAFPLNNSSVEEANELLFKYN